MKFLRIPFAFKNLGCDSSNPLVIPPLGLTILFGRETIRKWRRFSQQEPDNINVRLILAHLLEIELRLEEAIQEYRTCIDKFAAGEAILPSGASSVHLIAQVHFHLADALFQAGRKGEAIEEWKQVAVMQSEGFGQRAARRVRVLSEGGPASLRRSVLLIIHNDHSVREETFSDCAAAYQVYDDKKNAVRRKEIMGIGLVDLFLDLDGGYGVRIYPLKNQEVREQILNMAETLGALSA